MGTPSADERRNRKRSVTVSTLRTGPTDYVTFGNRSKRSPSTATSTTSWSRVCSRLRWASKPAVCHGPCSTRTNWYEPFGASVTRSIVTLPKQLSPCVYQSPLLRDAAARRDRSVRPTSAQYLQCHVLEPAALLPRCQRLCQAHALVSQLPGCTGSSFLHLHRNPTALGSR